MATLTNPLNIKSGDTVYTCTCYTTTTEATPTTITGGSYWEFKNNNTVCYVGLWPTSVSGGSFHTPLKIKKNNVEYYVETKVVNNYTVTITQSSNQTIKVTCNGSTYTSTFSAPAGASYTVTVTPSTGYTAGAPSSSSGYVNSNITITASAASKNKYTVTITQSSNQTIKVTCGGTTYTSSFTAEHGATWTATVTPSTGYNAGTLSASSGTVTGAVTISATAASIKKYTVTITQSANQTITVTCGGTNYTSSFTANHGSTWTAKVAASSGYTAGTLSASSGTLTGNITISATAAKVNEGVLLYSGTTGAVSFTAPAGCNYVSLNAGYTMVAIGGKGAPGSTKNIAIQRVAVTAGKTYSISVLTSFESGTSFGTYSTIYPTTSPYGTWFNYEDANSLGNTCMPTNWTYQPASYTVFQCISLFFQVYTDDGSGNPYGGSDFKTAYTEITGGTYS